MNPKIGDRWKMGERVLVIENVTPTHITFAGKTVTIEHYNTMAQRTLAKGGIFERLTDYYEI